MKVCSGHCLNVYIHFNSHLYPLHKISIMRIISLMKKLKSGGGAGTQTEFFSNNLIRLANVEESGGSETKIIP